MRPVNKLPGNSVAVTAFYTPPTNFKFTKPLVVKNYVQQKFHTNNPTRNQCLTELQRINAIAKANRSAGEKAFKKAMGGRVSDEYVKAGPALMFFLANYCSYCETVITQLAEVEHVRPKSIITVSALKWDNFLLACGPCNNAKSNDPKRSDIQALLGLAQPPTDQQYEQGLMDYYMWPDKDAKTYRWTEYALHRVTGGGTAALPADQQISLGHTNVVLDPIARTVKANIFNPNTNASPNRSVRVNARGTGGASAKQVNADASQRSLDLLEINLLRGDRHSYDSRVLRKTGCWFEALNTISRIRQLSPPNISQQLYDAFWAQAMATAKLAGFFSVWLTVFNTYPNLTRFNDDYATKFLSLVGDDNFKNTNTTKLP
jgi:hypothetical protein